MSVECFVDNGGSEDDILLLSGFSATNTVLLPGVLEDADRTVSGADNDEDDDDDDDNVRIIIIFGYRRCDKEER